MKTLKTALAILAVLAVTAGIHVSAAADEKKAEGVLQVHVTIPPTPSPNAEYDVGDRFTAIMSDTFRGLGYDGDIEWIKNLDEPKPDWPLLRVNITHWERRPTGNLEVRFSATLEAAGKTHSLGSYFGTSPAVMNVPGRFGTSEAVDRAAEDALRKLYDDLAETDLIVGLRKN